ncbi:unnamed protein product [Nippostrongylus brasiliensis]|uniref:SH3 domain-containing protein n=1 Tax=Nippostrongylus brasiliensis TaxID=27835 RepID=A0A0N4YT30_NIPBR|nr:unnamed protein product [Nippostrongylus brasiliensis]
MSKCVANVGDMIHHQLDIAADLVALIWSAASTAGNVEGGWMEGSNSRGQVGLFPESYVVPYYSAPPTIPPVS